jgi:AraC-like DNA-binding protein/quercetin dioxygenase-like cupin family protein|uniref:helix-turn-helix domain-containing protein n=1 Tax=Cephaloticoccus sp. TaxID=1985742 RepID=UPI00404B20D3
MKNPVSRPIAVTLPTYGLAFAESVHSPGFRMAERADPFHKVIYVLQGHITFTESGKDIPLQAASGTALCVNAKVRHKLSDTEPSTLLLLCFTREFMTRDPGLEQLWVSLTKGQAATLHQGGTWGTRFEALWRTGVVEQTGNQPGREIAVRAAAENILVALSRLPVDAPEDPALQRVTNVTQELTETFFEPWSLERACARAGMSRRHFSKLFRIITGHTFLEHLTELRLTHASRLLDENRHSIIGAAFSSGYGDLSHFYRLFRARFGQPPRAWLEKKHGAVLPSKD